MEKVSVSREFAFAIRVGVDKTALRDYMFHKFHWHAIIAKTMELVKMDNASALQSLPG